MIKSANSIMIIGSVTSQDNRKLLIARDKTNNYYKSANPADAVFKVMSETFEKITDPTEAITYLLEINKCSSVIENRHLFLA